MVLRDSDVFPGKTDPVNVTWKERPTAKVVLLDEAGQVALIGNKVNSYFLLPGGGLENGEDQIEGAKRECKEETGCDIEILRHLGVTEDFRARDMRHCLSFGYVAKVISHGTSDLTEKETDVGAYVKWFKIADAQKLLAEQSEKVRKGEVAFYNTCFNTLRDSLFLNLSQKS